jgi:hypothetical protein
MLYHTLPYTAVTGIYKCSRKKKILKLVTWRGEGGAERKLEIGKLDGKFGMNNKKTTKNWPGYFCKPGGMEMYEHSKLYPNLYPIAWKGD